MSLKTKGFLELKGMEQKIPNILASVTYVCLYSQSGSYSRKRSYKTHPIHQSILVLEGRKSI